MQNIIAAKKAGLISLLFLIAGCSTKIYHLEKTNNPVYRENTAFVAYEDLSDPGFDSLKQKYQLDTIFHGETDEFKRILLLRNWIRSKISINDFSPTYPGEGHPAGIIDAAMAGQGYHCGHYMIVQNAIMNAYGYVTRCIGSGPGIKGGEDGHHGINEIWLNKQQKWFLSDAKFNHHFEKNGIPLSALEVRDEFLKNKAADVQLVKGPDRIPITSDKLANKSGIYIDRNKEWFAEVYTWLEWDRSGNRFTAWPDFDTKLNMYRDEYFKNHTWIWDGKPHWAYNTDHLVYIDDREAIEWTPNTLAAQVSINKNQADISLTSSTPNLKEYQMKKNPALDWIRCDSTLSLPLKEDRYELIFRAINTANVSGPEYNVTLVSQ